MRFVDYAVYFIFFLVVLGIVLEIFVPGASGRFRPPIRLSTPKVKEKPITKHLS